MPLARPYSSKPSSRQARQCLAGISTTCCLVVRSSGGGGLAGVGVPNENRISVLAFWHCGASFNPARASLHVLFYWKGDLVPRFRREQYFWHHGAETPSYQCHLAAAAPIPCGRASGTPNLRWFRSNRRVSVPAACFHATTVHIERGIRVPFPSRAISSGNRVPSSSCRRHLLLLWRPCIPGGCKDGTPNQRISVRFRFCPGRTQRPLLLSVRIHHVRSPVVKALSIS